MSGLRLVGALACAGVLAGCAPSRSAIFGEVRADLEDRLPQRVHWYAGASADDEIRTALRALLRAPLAVEGAVQVALLSNRHLQALYERLGLSQGDLIEAGMLSNPVLSVASRLPSGGALSVDLDIVSSLLSLLLAPARHAIASAELRATELAVADEVLRFAASVEKLYYHAQATAQIASVRRAIAETSAGSADLARALHDAGNLNERAMSEELAAFEGARIALAESESDAVLAREELIRAMGVFGMQTRFVFAGELPPVPDRLPPLADAERDAVRDRLDLRAARQQVGALAAGAGLADGSAWLAAFDVGVSAEHTPGWYQNPPGTQARKV